MTTSVARIALLLALLPATAGAAAADREPARAGRRTLEVVHIVGEMPVPQVLFVTARDQRRIVEFQHHRYRRSSREIAAAAPFPARPVTVTTADVHARKEASP